jgi:iron complex outermembrane receptor protein
VLFLTGKDDFEPERVDAYEVGYRGRPAEPLSLSFAAFYNEYDDLRTVEPTAVTLLPLHWDNLMRGHTYGIEAWAQWQVNDWWRLSPGMRLLRKGLEFKPSAFQLLGLTQAGDDARSQATLTSSMDFGRVTADIYLRYVAALPDPALDEYYELNVRFGWQVSPQVDVSLTGSNLLHGTHQESPLDAYIRSGVYGEVRWQF